MIDGRVLAEPTNDATDRSDGSDAAVFLGRLTRGCFQGLVAAAPCSAAEQRALVRALHRVIVLRFCECRGLEPAGRLLAAVGHGRGPRHGLRSVFAGARARYGRLFDEPAPRALYAARDALVRFVEELCAPEVERGLARWPVETVAQSYEQCLASCEQGARRKSDGVFYTPVPIADRLLAHTLDARIAKSSYEALASMRVLDPSCGSGVFLVGAYRRLLGAHLAHWKKRPAGAREGRVVRVRGAWRLTWAARLDILQASIHGADLDAHALELARFSLLLEALEHGRIPADAAGARAGDLDVDGDVGFGLGLGSRPVGNLRWGNSLFGPEVRAVSGGDMPGLDWSRSLDATGGRGFDVVIGNPPWGQKEIAVTDAVKKYLRRAYPSTRGIFDWFRPFVELGVRLTRRGGYFGMVLPDNVLLKNYESTRRLLLDELSLTRIEWLGTAFAGAAIDAVTIAGRRARARPEHRVSVVVDDPARPLRHECKQDDFRANPRCTFNLHLTEEKRRVLRRLQELPRLGRFFEVHEGIHSGNMRAEIFVDKKLDRSCRPLLFGRDELRPYALFWRGRYVRLSAMPARRTPERYANLGRMEWYETDKLVVRRTGDRVTAALDREGRFASNNFFLVMAREDEDADEAGTLTLDGLCALLNSRFMTWYFRTIEPRTGRVFAELKIKHLRDFPLPPLARVASRVCLDALGRRRRELSQCEDLDAPDARLDARLIDVDRAIDEVVFDAMGVDVDVVVGVDRPPDVEY